MSQSQLLPTVPCPFSFKDHEIRTIQEDDGTLWFAAKDVCAALGVTWSGATLKGIPSHWQGMLNFNTPSGIQRLRALQEPGVYKLAFRSNKEDADEFTNWVASDVVPSIRKTGQYATPELPAQPALESPDAVRLSKRTDPERKELTAMINAWVGCAPIHYAGARSMINAHFGVKGVDEMTVAQVKTAIEFVQGKINALPKALPEPEKPSLPVPRVSEEEAKSRALKARMEAIHKGAYAVYDELCAEALLHRRRGGDALGITEVSALSAMINSIKAAKYAMESVAYAHNWVSYGHLARTGVAMSEWNHECARSTMKRFREEMDRMIGKEPHAGISARL